MSTPQLPDIAAINRAFEKGAAEALANMTKVIADFNAAMPFIAARMAEALQPLGAAHQQIKPLMRYAVYAAADDGMPEAEIARRAGLDRMTVRSWLGKQLKRGDRVTGTQYGGDEAVAGAYVPRDDFPDARPPVDAAWIDDGSVDGPWMVKRETVKQTMLSAPPQGE
jgi:hypothetical protein